VSKQLDIIEAIVAKSGSLRRRKGQGYKGRTFGVDKYSTLWYTLFHKSVNRVSKQLDIIEAIIAKSGSLRSAARMLDYEPGYICELRKEHKLPSLNFIQAAGTVYPELIPMLSAYLWGSAYTNQDKGGEGDGLMSKSAVL